MKNILLSIVTLILFFSCTSRADRIDTSGNSEGELEVTIDGVDTTFGFVRLGDDLYVSNGVTYNNLNVIANTSQYSETRIGLIVLTDAISNEILNITDFQYSKDNITYSLFYSPDFSVNIISFDGERLEAEFSGSLYGMNENSESVYVDMTNGYLTVADLY